ncbi:MAG: hypothetical protein ABR941_00265 [Thermoleophilia bacterium]
MSRRWLIYALVAVLAAAAVAIGIVTSRAQGSTATLPSITPAQLLAKVAAAPQTTKAVSGDVAWSNGLIPGSDLSNLFSGGGAAPTSLTSLLMGGSGRLWISQGGGLRLQSQGGGADFVLVSGKNGVWSYSSASGTATQYAPPAGAGGRRAGASPSPRPTPGDPLAAISGALRRFAATGTVAVSGQTTVAGRQSYILTVTPTSTVTTFGSLQVAVDGKTFVPLRVQVFAKGDTTPTLSAGFTRVSYRSIAGDLFSFTPPAGATVQHTALPSLRGLSGGAQSQTKPATHAASLTLTQARAKAAGYGLVLAAPRQGSSPASLAFDGATVAPPARGHGATAILRYGTGFGSVALVETQVSAGAPANLQQSLAKLPRGLIATTTVAGSPGYELSTGLFNVIAWQHGKLTVVAAGMVPQATLQAFAATVG